MGTRRGWDGAPSGGCCLAGDGGAFADSRRKFCLDLGGPLVSSSLPGVVVINWCVVWKMWLHLLRTGENAAYAQSFASINEFVVPSAVSRQPMTPCPLPLSLVWNFKLWNVHYGPKDPCFRVHRVLSPRALRTCLISFAIIVANFYLPYQLFICP